MTLREPQRGAYYRHDQQLVEVEPALSEHRTEHPHHMLVVESAHGSCHGSCCHAPYPPVVPEVYVLLFAGAAHEENGEDGQQDTGPLIEIESFAEDDHGSHEHHHRTGRIDRPDDGQRDVLEAEISADP